MSSQAAFCTGCGVGTGTGNRFCFNCGAAADPAAVVCIKCGVALQGAPHAAPGGYPGAPATGYAPPLGGMPGVQPMAMDYATWANRVIGYLIDAVLIGVGMLIIWFIAGSLLATLGAIGGEGMHGAFAGSCCLMIMLFPLATFLVGLFNRVYLVSTRGASIGQGVVKVKVVDASGNFLTMGTAFIRLLAQAGMGFVPFLPLLDLLWPLWDERRQTLHDKAVGCYVVNQPQ